MLTLQQQISLKDLMKQQKMTQVMLAKHLKLSRSYVSSLINTSIDELSLKNIKMICNALGYSIEILVTN